MSEDFRRGGEPKRRLKEGTARIFPSKKGLRKGKRELKSICT